MRFSSFLVAVLAGTTSATYFKYTSNGDVEVSSRNFKKHAKRHAKRQNGTEKAGWNPPSELAAPLKEVWDHVSSTYNGGDIFGFKNYGWDSLIANKG